MLNQAVEQMNILIQRLESVFQIQTHEVVKDLKTIRDMLIVPSDTKPVIEQHTQDVIVEG